MRQLPEIGRHDVGSLQAPAAALPAPSIPLVACRETAAQTDHASGTDPGPRLRSVVRLI
jgi:hypothetical protein